MNTGEFTIVPWKKSPNWLDVLKKIYLMIGPIPPSLGSRYSLNVFPPSKQGNDWIFTFNDDFSGKTYAYSWTGNAKDNTKKFD